MGAVKSDIEIARKAKMKPIKDVLSKINVPDTTYAFSPQGRHIAKLNFPDSAILASAHLIITDEALSPNSLDDDVLIFINIYLSWRELNFFTCSCIFI